MEIEIVTEREILLFNTNVFIKKRDDNVKYNHSYKLFSYIVYIKTNKNIKSSNLFYLIVVRNIMSSKKCLKYLQRVDFPHLVENIVL